MKNDQFFNYKIFVSSDNQIFDFNFFNDFYIKYQKNCSLHVILLWVEIIESENQTKNDSDMSRVKRSRNVS